MKFIRQSTSAVIVFGPFVGPSDGVTLVTSLVSAIDHASTGIFINKNGGAGAVRHASVTASTYDAYGNYLVTLDTTDTNTLGRLRVTFAAAASCLPVWEEYMVLASNVYDSLVAASSNLQVDVTKLLGTAWLTPGTAGTPDVNAKLVGATSQTGRDLGATLGAAGAGLTALGDTRIAFLDVAITSRTKPADTQAAVTTAVNLTNAPTAGDFTAAMKTSLNAATPSGSDTSGVTTLLTRVTEHQNNIAAADVLTQVNLALDTAGSELVTVPSTTGSLRQKIGLIFQYFRNKRTITASTETLLKEDASTVLGTSSVTDDGTTFTKGELN